MIKCDNPNCKREWFHFQCVGIEDQPKGKWFYIVMPIIAIIGVTVLIIL